MIRSWRLSVKANVGRQARRGLASCVIAMLYLTEKDILDAASVDEMVDAIEASLLTYAKGQFLMPQRMHIDQGDNTMLLMPCFIEDYFATKLITLFPSNPEKGLPILNGIVVLNDAQTGLPVALLNAPVLTGLRTAAVAAVSIRHLAPVGCESVGIVGAGVQGFYQAWFASSISGAGHAYIYDVCSEKTVGLIEKLQSVIPQVELHQAARVEELLENSQVVITATTSCEPVLPDDEQLLRGKHFIGIGSYKPAVREFPRALFSLVKAVFTDTDHALEESGDLIRRSQETDHLFQVRRDGPVRPLCIQADLRKGRRAGPRPASNPITKA